MSVTTLKGYDGNKKLTGRKRFIIYWTMIRLMSRRIRETKS